LNDLNCYLLYLPEEHQPKKFNQEEIIEISDQDKIVSPEWNESMFKINIHFFEMFYEESVSYFKRMENLEKIRHTSGPGPAKVPVNDKNMCICYH
jgi:hypothetical protein